MVFSISPMNLSSFSNFTARRTLGRITFFLPNPPMERVVTKINFFPHRMSIINIIFTHPFSVARERAKLCWSALRNEESLFTKQALNFFMSFPKGVFFPKRKSISIFRFGISFFKFCFRMVADFKTSFTGVRFLVNMKTILRTKLSNCISFMWAFFNRFFTYLANVVHRLNITQLMMERKLYFIY